MASDGDIEASVAEMVKFIAEKAPMLSPAIFVKLQKPEKVADLVSTAQQVATLESKWSGRNNTGVIFVTEVDYRQKTVFIKEIRASASELDVKLSNLEAMMEMFVQGSEEEVAVMTARFLEVNGYDKKNKKESDNKYIMHAVYNAAYAVKVILSNTPMKTQLFRTKKETFALPLAEEVDALAVIEAITTKAGKGKEAGAAAAAASKSKRKAETAAGSDSDSDGDSDGSTEDQSQKKRRKKKRGGGKK
jgi:hypothetical protein